MSDVNDENVMVFPAGTEVRTHLGVWVTTWVAVDERGNNAPGGNERGEGGAAEIGELLAQGWEPLGVGLYLRRHPLDPARTERVRVHAFRCQEDLVVAHCPDQTLAVVPPGKSWRVTPSPTLSPVEAGVPRVRRFPPGSRFDERLTWAINIKLSGDPQLTGLLLDGWEPYAINVYPLPTPAGEIKIMRELCLRKQVIQRVALLPDGRVVVLDDGVVPIVEESEAAALAAAASKPPPADLVAVEGEGGEE